MQIQAVEVGVLDTNCYLVDNEGELVIIDPGYCSDELIRAIEATDAKPVAVLITHAHFDHISGIDPIVRRYRIPVYALDQEEVTFKLPASDRAKAQIGGDVTALVNTPIDYFEEGRVLELAGLRFETLWIRGHSHGGCCYYLRDQGVLFPGDSIFYGSIGRTDLEHGDYEALVTGLREKVLTLPDETIIYPGHGPATQVAFEREHNPFLRGNS